MDWYAYFFGVLGFLGYPFIVVIGGLWVVSWGLRFLFGLIRGG